MRYDELKPLPKRIWQALFRFCVYGALLVAGEVAFYSITKIGRSISFLSFLFQYDWEVDTRLALHHIWDVPIPTFFGQASLYMFLVYGAICVFGLEPGYRFMKKKDVPVLLRGIVYMCTILFMECSLGWVLRWTTGYDIWIYYGPGTLLTYTSLAIAPMWFLCGLFSENVIGIIDSLDELKLSAYGLDEDSTGSRGKRDKTVIISDVHIGPSGEEGKGWFYGIYEIYFTIILYKISMDRRVREIVFLGDLFDTWLYPVEERPDTVRAIVGKWKSSPFMAPLLECVRKCDAVWYIPGNHDMHVSQDDLASLSSGGKTIKLVTAEEFNARHTSGSCPIHMEHGNDADFFNAPDNDGDTVQHMPFGYFVSRLVAASPEFDIDATFNAAYLGIAAVGVSARGDESEDHRAGRAFIELFVDALVAWANAHRPETEKIGNDTVIRMPEGYADTTIAEIKTKYSSLLGEWLKNRKTYFFAAAGKNGLNEYARKQFGEIRWDLWLRRLFSARRPEKIVVMGHTHYGRVERVMNREKQGIYANSGCICANRKQAGAHWLEIRESKKGCDVKLKRL